MSRTDTLPHTPAVSALVRRIAFRLDGDLRFNGHHALSHEERYTLFDLGEASKLLDRIAILPRMAQHEERARRNLLELYDVFDREPPPAIGHTEPFESCALCQTPEDIGDAQGCMP